MTGGETRLVGGCHVIGHEVIILLTVNGIKAEPDEGTLLHRSLLARSKLLDNVKRRQSPGVSAAGHTTLRDPEPRH